MKQLLFLGLLFILEINAQLHCTGNVQIQSTRGTIKDPVGHANYEDQKACNWYIFPGTNRGVVTIKFSKFDVEYNYDYLQIFNSSTTPTPVVALTGYKLPNPMDIPFEDSVVRIRFLIDQLISFTGFELQYYASNCSQSCGQGYCGEDGTCQCYAGYTGAACDQFTCTNNCSFNGYCNDANQCVCNPGYDGLDCSTVKTTYCSGLVQQASGSIGNFSDQLPFGGPYLPSMNCQWNVSTGGPTTIVLTHHQFANEGDVLQVRDGPSESASVLATLSQSSYAPYPTVSFSGNFFVTFSTNEYQEFTGFNLLYTRNDLCPDSCNNNGFCIAGKCACFSMYTGDSCNGEVEARKLESSQIVTDQVDDFQWKYYFYEVVEADVDDDDTTVLDIYFSKSVNIPNNTLSNSWKWSGGYPEFYVAYSAFPSHEYYTIASAYYNNAPMSITHPNAGFWYLGVFGREASEFTVSFHLRKRAPNTSSNPRTEPTTDAHNQDSSSNKKSTASPGLIIALVLIVLSVVGVVAVAVFWIVRRKKTPTVAQPTTFVKLDEENTPIPN